MTDSLLVMNGGTLIDGRGGPPLENAVVVIKNGRFLSIGQSGQIEIPPGAKVVDTRGLTLLPGFIDGHGHLEDFHGELYLHLGITTCASIKTSQDGAWAIAQRDGTKAGKIRGPRIWTSGRAIGGPRTFTDAPVGSAGRGNITVTTVEEAKEAVRKKKARGFDLIKMNEFASFDLIRAVAEEAHANGMAVTAHSWDVIESVKAGVDGIEHIWSVGYSSILDVKKRRDLAKQRLAGNIDQELAGGFYEVENFDAIIEIMVKHDVSWTPTIAKWLRPLSPNAARFRERENQILNNPDANLPPTLRAVTDSAYDKLFKKYSPSQLDRTKVFYEKANEFIRRFVAAGGRLKEGSDPPRGMAAMLVHEALAMDVEAGVPPMTAIQAATINVAKTFKKDKDYGSVEPGKIADLSIIEGDPLKDIWMTQNVKMVVIDGRMVDIAFQKYENPIPSFYTDQTLPRDLTIHPLRVREGAAPFTLSVKGEGMWSFHRVHLNGAPLPTKFKSKTELEATVSPQDIAAAGTYIVTVKADGERIPESHRAHLVVSFT
jgi:imidazolonepropionase-like amidohydrolase